jgi:hypothetical protein
MNSQKPKSRKAKDDGAVRFDVDVVELHRRRQGIVIREFGSNASKPLSSRHARDKADALQARRKKSSDFQKKSYRIFSRSYERR